MKNVRICLNSRHPLLNEVDYLAASILFAARDGWIGLPLILRDVSGLQEAVSHHMAQLAHRIVKSGIDLGTPPNCPRPLRALFIPGDKGWSAKQRDAALLLARELKWTECIQTRILLGKGDYRIIVDGTGVQIMLPGSEACTDGNQPTAILRIIKQNHNTTQTGQESQRFIEDLRNHNGNDSDRSSRNT